VIEKWCSLNLKTDKSKIPELNPILYQIDKKIRKMAGLPTKNYSIKIGYLCIWSSERGRYFPIKSFDDEYFQLLSKSKFVLCPSGDYIWTYRFFESILCGAIPIVEEKCEAYEGFAFKMMNEFIGNNVVWDPEIAEYNYKLCTKRISIPIDLINKELKNLLLKQ